MTKYILDGGSGRDREDYGESLSLEVRKQIGNPAILSCFFSSDETSWPEQSRDWDEWFRRYFGHSVLHETATREGFFDQVETADLVYLHGGETVRLLGALADYKRAEKAFEGKIVVGSSAGANYLSRAGYSPSADKFLLGSGIVDLNVLVHYGAHNAMHSEDWGQVENRFRDYLGQDRVITRLPEGEFVVVEQ